MSDETRKRILEALEAAHGNAADNAHRARAAFRGLGSSDLAKEYGESGRTRADMLATYEREEAQAFQALKEFAPDWKPKRAFSEPGR